ncbi:hypothetical protein SISSUDRAFT_121421 [Sistotremastrum suecicum HHB10207 ss-3]|uniref:Uncharacterized protein n=1 Tax=Sistotremastrum suecicum HHB10207 ss-3 TaxID=1314776 RepID=A0A166B1B2_9AGAM|nr:hypothetical protein SISSUDRAFT_121421 [Sistotremastrum suecicum HHB10207 ss-3]
MGSVVSAIGRGIEAIISAIANVFMAIPLLWCRKPYTNERRRHGPQTRRRRDLLVGSYMILLFLHPILFIHLSHHDCLC